MKNVTDKASECTALQEQYADIFRTGYLEALPFNRVSTQVRNAVLTNYEFYCVVYDDFGKSVMPNGYAVYLVGYNGNSYLYAKGGISGNERIVFGPIGK